MKKLYRIAFLSCVGLSLGMGCGEDEKPPLPKKPMAVLPPKVVPEAFKGSIIEQVDLINTDAARVSGYGLVVNLNGTGDTRAPGPVREYIIKTMGKHGFGSTLQPGFEKANPEAVLRDPRVAIARVDGFIPAGARSGQGFDVQVAALENSNTTSLAHGRLYRTDLAPRGADPMNPGGGLVNSMARADGPIFVNPAYLAGDKADSTGQRLSLRYGIVMGRGVVNDDRPLVLRLRQPQWRMSRLIEERLNERFQGLADTMRKGMGTGMVVAQAQDNGSVYIYVPRAFKNDWEHFAGIALHTYFTPQSDIAAVRSQILAKAALEPDAPLNDISYAWEALGESALPAIRPLMSNPKPDIAFAATRAAAYLNDLSAQESLKGIALSRNNPYQINAIQILGKLPQTPRVREILYAILDTDQTAARVEVYRILADNSDARLVSRQIADEFLLDLVPSDGPPLVYATRTGVPRVAFIGRRPQVAVPVTFLTMKNTVQIVSDDQKLLTLFYRGPEGQKEISVQSRPDLAEVVGRFGGEGPQGEQAIKLGYSEIVAILTSLSDRKLIAGPVDSPRLQVAFTLESAPGIDDPIMNAPVIDDQRPQDVPDKTPGAVDPAIPEKPTAALTPEGQRPQ